MSRTARASVAAAFTYARFGLSTVAALAMVPFVLSRVDAVVYALWLVSGEVLAYAAMTDLGLVGILPWIIAEADGRKDRRAVRSAVANGFVASVGVAATYLLAVMVLWQVAPDWLHLTPEQRATIAGPLAVMACATGLVLPFRVSTAALTGLQDVRFCGVVSTAAWMLDVTITLVLLTQGYGLYALACGASVPAVVGVIAHVVRLRMIAPDLLRSWPSPDLGQIRGLLRDGFGAWLASWGWRLSAATDGIVLAFVGYPLGVTRLAMTSKLGQLLMQLAWVPGDNGLVGLAQLSGEADLGRLRAALSALFRLYLTLACAAAVFVLTANASFIAWWLPPDPPLFAGSVVNVLLGAALVVGTASHALAAAVSVLGGRILVGSVTLIGGMVQVGLAYFLVRRVGLAAMPLAAVLSQSFVVLPLLASPVMGHARAGCRELLSGAVRGWLARSLAVLALATALGVLLADVTLFFSGPVAALFAVAYLWSSRGFVLAYAPVNDVLRGPLTRLRLQALLPAAARGEGGTQ